MNKQQKQKMGQDLVDFMLDDLSLDEIAETFEMKVDTKLILPRKSGHKESDDYNHFWRCSYGKKAQEVHERI